jgi:hypothetical protein
MTRGGIKKSFADLESLLEHLEQAAIIELGNPLPSDKYLPKRSRGLTPAQINRRLFDRGEADHG